MQRDFIFKIKGNKYNVKFPTPRVIIDLESQKALLTNGMYRQIMGASTMSANYALDIVDMHAHITVMCPDVFTDIKAKGTLVLDMDIMDFNQLKLAYDKQFTPWISSWWKVLSAPPEELKTPEGAKPTEMALEVTEEIPVEKALPKPAQFAEGNEKKTVMMSEFDDIPNETDLG